MNCCDLLYFSKYRTEPLKQSIMRTNVHDELVFVKSGNCTAYCENSSTAMGADDIVMIPADVSYRFEFDLACELYIIGFDASSGNFGSHITFYEKYNNNSISCIFEQICNEFYGYNLHRKHMLNLLLNVILINLCRNDKACDPKKNIETDNFYLMLNFMDSHSNNGLDINEIAENCGLSYHRFRHRFKELVGISPQQYIIKQRINFAKRLLETTDYKTSLIAEACGFHSVPQFITCFSKQEGLTPVKYRKYIKDKSLAKTLAKAKAI